jgi:DNA polymerase V
MIGLVDCNNFFASCERLFRPNLKNRPVLVLSNNDGCVVARSEEVKRLDIPMGVPYFKVRTIVENNDVACFSSNFALYSNISQRILTVLAQWVPKLEVYSIDEAFLDLSSLQVPDCGKWGNALRNEIKHNIGMPVSVGIAPTKTLAKLASGYAKKHQQSCVLDPNKDPQYFKKVLESVPVGDIWGIGRRLAPRFARVGIHTAWQLAQASEAWMHSQLGITGTRMRQELHGKIAYPLDEGRQPQKTLMASRSFGHTVKGVHELEAAVANFASQAAFRLRKYNQTTQVFGLYLRYRQPDGLTRGQSAAAKLLTATNDTSELVGVALQLLKKLYDTELGYKKAGVFAYHLEDAALSQLSFLDSKSPAERDRRKLFMQAVDSINARYGNDTIYISAMDPRARKWHARKERMSPAYTTDWSQLPSIYSL